MNRGAWTRVENFDLSTTSVGGLYRFLGGSISSIEVLKVSRACCRVSQPEDRSTILSRRGKTPADCFQASKFKLDGWESTPCSNRRRPVRWGTVNGLPRTAESWVATRAMPAVNIRGANASGVRKATRWVFQLLLEDKLYSIGYFRKQRAVGFREPDLKTVLIVCNTLDAKLDRI